MGLIGNYIITSLRHIWRKKLYALINLSGLAIAITCVLFALLFIRDETSYDNFHEKGRQLFRITTTRTDQKGERKEVGGTGQPQGPAFRDAVPEVLNYTRLLGGDIRGDVIANGKTLNLQMVFADPSFFELFSFPLVRGNAQTALKDIYSVVVTESIAMKYFNTVDIVGKEFTMDADPSADRLARPMVVSAVAKDIPRNSSIRFEVLMPLQYMQLSFTDTAWLNQYLSTFVLLTPNADQRK